MLKFGTCIAALAVATLSLSPSAASAQATVATPATPIDSAAASDLGGEIIVTAQKRSQRVQDVGIAITAYSGAQLRALNITDSRELASFSPGVHTGGNIAGQNTQYTIRGVTQNDFADIVEAPNAVYLDEGYIAVAQGQTFALFDIDRVEVLKGPQGTLFGRNATGGLVHFITVKPDLDKVEGFVDLKYGLYESVGTPGTFHGEAALNVPLSPKLAVRAAMMWNKSDPLLRNEYPVGAVGGAPGAGAGANLGDDDTLAGRITTLFKPSETSSFTLSVNAARSRMATAPYQAKSTIAHFNAAGELVDVTNTAAGETRASIAANGSDAGTDTDNNGVFGDSFGRPNPGGDFFGYKDPDGPDFRTSSDFAFKKQDHVKTIGANLTGDVELSDAVTLTSVTDYKHFSKLLFVDVDGGPGNQAANYAGVHASTVSQEFRLNGKVDNVNWVAGLYYLHIDNHAINGLKFPVGSVVPGAPFDLGLDAKLKTDSYSAFGQFDWQFAPKLTLVLGGRIIQEQKKYDFFQAIYATTGSRDAQDGPPTIIGPDAGKPYADKRGQTLWAGKAQLEYRPDSDLLLYVGINRGVKAGSYNAALAGGLPVPITAIPYKAEVLTSYEGGFKYTFPDGRTRFNAAGYYYDYKNYQAFLFTGVSGVVINANDTTYGGEAELFTSPIPGLDAGVSVSWFDATVKNVPLRVGGPISRDVKPVYAPQLQGTAILRYGFDAFGGRLSIGGDAEYTGAFYYNLRNFTADRYNRVIMVNTSVIWTLRDLQLSFAVKNVTDVRAGVQGFDLASFCGCNELSYKPPRLFQVGARYDF
ncbi:TonB-dependent receptor [Sphingosinicellaceae bacterium]|nr:TonB-dependent receptor [Sphingosinicellaceae bacterium]